MQVPELAPRSGAAQAPKGAAPQSGRVCDCPLPQLKGPTRVSGSSAPALSASHTWSDVVMPVPREITARWSAPSDGCVAEHDPPDAAVSQTLNAAQPEAVVQ